MKKIFTTLVIGAVYLSLFAQDRYEGAQIYSNETVLYGKFKFRARIMHGEGMVSAFNLYKPGSEQPDVFFEGIGFNMLGKNYATIASSSILTDGLSGDVRYDVEDYNTGFLLAEEYHTYTLEWTPSEVIWYVDSTQIRRETDSIPVKMLVSPQRFNLAAWVSCNQEWAGIPDPDNMPLFMEVDWIEYYSYFYREYTLEWRDDFDFFDNNRWSRANWTFDCNRADLIGENAWVENGNLVLAITDPNAENSSVDAIPSDEAIELTIIPRSGEIQLGFSQTSHYMIRLLTLQGTTVYTTELNGMDCTIPSAGLKAGIYLVNVLSGTSQVTRKVFIANR